MSFQEQVFRLGAGVDVYNPDVTSAELKFKRLMNLQPYSGRLNTSRGFSILPTTLGSSPVVAFAFATEPYQLYSSLFAVTEAAIYPYNFSLGAFSTTPAYTWPSGTGPIAVVPWYDVIYVTRKGAPLVKLSGTVATVVTDAPGGRYLALSNSHLMVGNLAYGTQNYPNRVRWSDLYAPESFEILESSEADYYELEPGDGENTGVSYQRGNNLIYTRNSIWIAQYNALPVGYKFDPLYSDVGCNFHGGLVSVKEKDYFIGVDGIYEIDGLQLKEIGDEIWSFFKADCATNAATGYLYTRVEKEKNSISWIYDKVGGGKWSIVYNYREQSWSDRDPQGVYASFYFPYSPRGFIPIDSVTSIINNSPNTTNMIDGDWQFPASSLLELHGGSAGAVYNANAAFQRSAGSAIAFQAETYEMFAETLFKKKEFDQAVLHFTGAGAPDIQLFIGTRNHRLDAVTWSSARALSTQLAGECVWHFRRDGVGKLVQFKLTWNNTSTDYVDQLTNFSLAKLENGPDTAEK